MTACDIRADLQAVFVHLDHTARGHIGLPELLQVCTELGIPNEKAALFLLKRLDSNGDGKVYVPHIPQETEAF
jgi:Ca2+-binding EF-hand superfamily protein